MRAAARERGGESAPCGSRAQTPDLHGGLPPRRSPVLKGLIPVRFQLPLIRIVLVALAAVVLTGAGGRPATAADEKGKVIVEMVEFGGWKNNLRISNGAVELIAALDVGPRLI